MKFGGVIWRNQNSTLAKNFKDYCENYCKHNFSTNVDLVYQVISPNNVDQIISNENLAIFGRVFSKETYKPFTGNTADNLLNHYWGKYIAFQQKDQKLEILRDPVGQLGFYYYITPDSNIIFSSEISFIIDIIKKRPNFCEKYLQNYLMYGTSFITEQTPFEGILELPPGSKLTVTQTKQFVEHVYDPFKYAMENNDSSWEKRNLVEIIQGVTKAWCEPYRHIVLSLSGGLDSSSLAYCLSSVQNEAQIVTAINMYHSHVGSSIEREYADKVCQHAGLDFASVDVIDHLPFDLADNLPYKPNKPQQNIIMKNSHIMNFLNLNTPSLFVSGHGGDHVFMCPPPKEALADFLIDNGVKGAGSELSELSYYYRSPFYQIAKKSVIPYFKYKMGISQNFSKLTYDNPAPWLNKKLVSDLYPHPIFKQADIKIKPGKLKQVTYFYRALPTLFLEHDDYTNPTFYPLLYQPIVEYCLQIPTYRLYKDGYDRYPFRQAISQYYKTDKVWRKDKGETTGIHQLGLKKHLGKVQQVCFNGYLAKNKMYDPDKLNVGLQRMIAGESEHSWSIINLVTLELFYSLWS